MSTNAPKSNLNDLDSRLEVRMLLLLALVLCRQEAMSLRMRLPRLLLLLLRTPSPEMKNLLAMTFKSFTEHGL
jgi:hypothetical protein